MKISDQLPHRSQAPIEVGSWVRCSDGQQKRSGWAHGRVVALDHRVEIAPGIAARAIQESAR